MGLIGFRSPLFFTGIADVREWYDDTPGMFRIDVRVINRFWGPLFGYRGAFSVEWKSVGPDEIPADVRPRREEHRE